MRHALLVLSLAVFVALIPLGVARAEGAAPVGADGQLREAKALFQEGNTRRRAGDLPGALEFYLRSRAVVPSMPNTFNAAYCLLQLGRIDEALELYEEVLIRFRGEVTPSQQQEISDSMTTLRRKLGNVDIAGDVGSLLLIDGKVRGTLPIVAPVHVLPGSHSVRVLKEGWEPFEAKAAVEAGGTVAIDVKLRPLAAAGRLRVESDTLKGAELVLDGAPLGTLPWEGTLAPGPHLIFARKGELGSNLHLAHVVQGQTVTERLLGVPIGPEVRVLVEPMTAEMWIDGVPVGKGQWRGTLTIGSHPIEARELGYVTAHERRTISRGASADIQLTLQIDPAHPRWAATRHPTGVVRLELFAGAALGLTLGSDASGSCSSTPCARDTLATGGIGGIRGSYTFPSRVLIEWVAGYLRLAQGVGRTLDDSFSEGTTPIHATASLDDELRIEGALLAAGVGYALPLGKHLDLRGALDLGAFLPSARDYVSGTATGGGRTLALNIGASGSPVYEAVPLVMPEVRLAGTFGAFEAGLGIGLAIFPFQGPSFPTGELRVYGASCAQHPLAVDCAPGTTAGSDRAYGPFGLFVPTAFVGERF